MYIYIDIGIYIYIYIMFTNVTALPLVGGLEVWIGGFPSALYKSGTSNPSNHQLKQYIYICIYIYTYITYIYVEN